MFVIPLVTVTAKQFDALHHEPLAMARKTCHTLQETDVML
jgi:hypothetical protein